MERIPFTAVLALRRVMYWPSPSLALYNPIKSEVLIGPEVENVTVTVPPTCSTPGCAVKSVTDVRTGVATKVGVAVNGVLAMSAQPFVGK